MVGNGDSMSVAAQITKNILRAAERPLAVHDPVLTVEFADEDTKRLRVRELPQLAVKADFALGESVVERSTHLRHEL